MFRLTGTHTTGFLVITSKPAIGVYLSVTASLTAGIVCVFTLPFRSLLWATVKNAANLV